VLLVRAAERGLLVLGLLAVVERDGVAADGRLKQWREDHGGFLCTIPRACGWLFLGIVGSFACEILFMLAFRAVAWQSSVEARLRLWLCLFPFASHAPLLPAWLWRRFYA
jgi:hypothetical protein